MHLSALSTLVPFIAAIGSANAWFRLPCTDPVVQERIDPIVQPGVISQHVHTVHGAKNFGRSATYDTLRASSCTSCLVKEDLSAYWTPTLYFKDPNTGQFEKVPNGGLLIYYQNRGTADKINGGPGLKAFPPGLKMVTGNPAWRSKKTATPVGSQAELRTRAGFWVCLRYNVGQPDYEGTGFPTTDCEAGLNARLHMPACWDGKNLDSPNHQDHVAYLSSMDNGSCPSTHPVALMKLFYEVTWDVTYFKSRWVGKPWPFVYSNSDPTGYGWHGDFFNGWATDVLQRAIDNCNSTPDQLNGIIQACKEFTLQTVDQAKSCKKTTEVTPAENVNGPIPKLPGCNPLQYGPGDATLYPTSNCPI
ncbi:hypothetical protein FRC03_009749 [Tulasnella sp. 419]|nr:hypothetical protein FRC02_008228 [Tulasnella sp. 418]KAG8957850.1 hypothetical protein FRC03_009749 [Tulasnella sp. 419]